MTLKPLPSAHTGLAPYVCMSRIGGTSPSFIGRLILQRRAMRMNAHSRRAACWRVPNRSEGPSISFRFGAVHYSLIREDASTTRGNRPNLKPQRGDFSGTPRRDNKTCHYIYSMGGINQMITIKNIGLRTRAVLGLTAFALTVSLMTAAPARAASDVKVEWLT